MKFLLLNMRERCRIVEKSTIIDLCDTDGNLLNVRDESIKTRYGITVFQPRKMYVLIEVKPPNDEDKTFRFIPLLNNPDIITDGFLNNLSPKLATQKSRHKNQSSQRNSSSRSNSVVTSNAGSALLNDQAKNRLRAMSIVSNTEKTNRRKSFAAPRA
jgi:hypothetical protein